MIDIQNLHHTLGKTTVLDAVNLCIPDGCILGLIGINGAGKSTLLRLMAGVYRPDQGQISYDGASPLHAATRRNIFFLPDDPYFQAKTTCKSMMRMYQAFYPDMDVATFQDYMNLFGLDMRKPLRNFSKGMRRQAYMAVALAIKPKYLLLDEAFDGLDPVARHTVKEALIHMVEEGGTVVISSHALRELEDFCDRFAILDHQCIRSSGDIADKLHSYCLFQLAFLHGVPENAFDSLPVVSVCESGKFVKIMLEGEHDILEAQLRALGPDVMEELPVNLEEAFIYDIQHGQFERGRQDALRQHKGSDASSQASDMEV